MDFVQKNPLLVLGVGAAIAFAALWWYRSREKKEDFSQKHKKRLKRVGLVASRVGDVGIGIADSILGTQISSVTSSRGGLYGTIKSFFR